jgi:hypothetical protein
MNMIMPFLAYHMAAMPRLGFHIESPRSSRSKSQRQKRRDARRMRKRNKRSKQK